MVIRFFYGILLLLAAPAAAVRAQGREPPPPADPLIVSLHTRDADRFAKLFGETGGTPTAEQIQRGYLDGASYGVGVFTPGRIRNAKYLADVIGKNPEPYRRAIETCLPAAKAAEPDLRSVYLGLRGLLPDAKLPQIYLVFGARNSGGTAGPGAQVLGLETLCEVAGEPSAFRKLLRQFFAHETVHTLQQNPGELASRSPLLARALMEGGADFITLLVTGEVPNPERAAWAAARERELWAEFKADIALTRNFDLQNAPKDAPGRAVFRRWDGNYGNAPDGRPHELGYWIGMRIWQNYLAAAPDKHKAVRDVLSWTDPEAILAASGYDGGGSTATLTNTTPSRD